MDDINERVIAALHGEMEETYPVYDRETMEQAARTYLDCVDREGFVFDFDLAWRWAGYSTKGNALRILKGTRGHLNLQEGVDYKIELARPAEIKNSSDNLIRADAEIKNQGAKHGGEIKNSPDNVIYPDGEIKKQGAKHRGEIKNSPDNLIYPDGEMKKQGAKHGGDRKSEKITLTAKGMNQFALAAHTPLGYCLRDVVLATSRILKHLMKEVQSGRVRIVRCHQGDERAVKRLKVCDTNKALMQEVASHNPSYCGRINGATNKATTGRYKYETARLLGKKPKEVNARDYMTPTQLASAELIEMLSREEITSNPGQDALMVHTDVANKVMHNIKDKVQGRIADEPLKLRNARRSMLDIENKQPSAPQIANTINNYFAPVSLTQQ